MSASSEQNKKNRNFELFIDRAKKNRTKRKTINKPKKEYKFYETTFLSSV